MSRTSIAGSTGSTRTARTGRGPVPRSTRSRNIPPPAPPLWPPRSDATPHRSSSTCGNSRTSASPSASNAATSCRHAALRTAAPDEPVRARSGRPRSGRGRYDALGDFVRPGRDAQLVVVLAPAEIDQVDPPPGGFGSDIQEQNEARRIAAESPIEHREPPGQAVAAEQAEVGSDELAAGAECGHQTGQPLTRGVRQRPDDVHDPRLVEPVPDSGVAVLRRLPLEEGLEHRAVGRLPLGSYLADLTRELATAARHLCQHVLRRRPHPLEVTVVAISKIDDGRPVSSAMEAHEWLL